MHLGMNIEELRATAQDARRALDQKKSLVFQEKLKKYQADNQPDSLISTPYAYPLRRGFLFLYVLTFAASKVRNDIRQAFFEMLTQLTRHTPCAHICVP